MILSLTRRLLICASVCLLAIDCGMDSIADDAESAEGSLTEGKKSELRLDYMVTAAGRFQFWLESPDERKAEAVKTPLIRWVNPHSNSRDGILVAYASGGRPVALGQFGIYVGGSMIHEFHTTSEQPFSMKRGERTYWVSTEPTIQFVDYPEADAPADSKALRTTQMRQLADRFDIWDEHKPDDPERHLLRLLRQPVYRYQDKTERVVDGAVMVYAMSNDPEAALLLEAYETDEGLKWRYALSPVSIYALEAKLHDQLVWSAENRSVFCRGYESQYVCPYQPEPGDRPIKEILPAEE